MELPAPFGKYLLTAKVATGGMAEVYLAKLIGPGGFEKPLIIKQIRQELSGRPRFVEMFVTEAKTLVSLSHGNIVPVYELGMVGDTYFLAMDYIDGPSLGELSRALADADKKLPVMTAAFIGAEILKGLDYAHRRGDGVIHRDLSPRNVLVSREGEVKIVDFGIAVTVAGEPDASQESGLPEGSFPYMSPEQARGEALDARTDVFSAGILLWELCAGRTLFARDSAEATLLAVLDADIPRLSEVRSEILPALDDACARALTRDREKRFQTAAEFLAALGQCLYVARPPQTSASVGALVAATIPRTRGRDEEAKSIAETAPSGPATRPLARPRPHGKRKADPVKTFATHVAIEQALSTASRPRRKRWLAAFAIAALALVAGAAVMTPWAQSRELTDPTPKVATIADAGQKSSLDARPPVMADAPPDLDSRVRVKTTRQRNHPPAPEHAPERPSPDKAMATLKVGANPWADVYVDGKRIGRAPGSWEVAAGPHEIEVVFPVPGREDRRQFELDLGAGDTRSLGVIDFSR